MPTALRLARLLVVSSIACAAGCGGIAEGPPQDPSPPGSVATAPRAPAGSASSPSPPRPPGSSPANPSTPTPCGTFGGKIHGFSTCVHVDRATGAVTNSAARPASVKAGANCTSDPFNEDVVLDTVTIRLRCDETSTGGNKRVIVTALIVDDEAHPARNGTRVVLDDRTGFWDFVHAWILERGSKIEMAIDYGVLE